MLLFKIGFIPVRIWDILDILIVGFVIYQIYRLLRGSIAFNIFIGVVVLYVLWWLVGMLQMDMLSLLLNQFVSLGLLILIVIFQPEVRRFFFLLGNTTLRQRSNFLSRLFDKNLDGQKLDNEQRAAIRAAVLRMSRLRIGALIVFSGGLDMDSIVSTGVRLDAFITQPLIESIFQKNSPLHDGAMIISNRRIHASGCILPVSDNPGLPKNAGLRHRAGVGVTERMNVNALIVSEETGSISMASEGKLRRRMTEEELDEALAGIFTS
ncbi:MAG: diadenylate cyclase CdaA [Saprospiraceae bacterium]|nr:diadenylate cyclase CdaA [Saprospiraceae bacterium]